MCLLPDRIADMPGITGLLRRYILPGLFILLLLLSASACQGTPTANFPTPYPTEYLPTVIAMTAAALRSPTYTPTQAATTPAPSTPTRPAPTDTPKPTFTPSQTFTPTRRPTITTTPTVTRRPTRTPTVTLTPEIVPAAIQLFAPGPMSKVLSPLRMYAYMKPGPTYKVRIELIGEDGRLLVRLVQKYPEDSGSVIGVLEDIDFEVAGVSEKARLVVSTDDTFGRIVSLASVDVILLSLGEADLNPYSDLLETIVIHQPAVNSLIQGGKITVSGQARLEHGDVLIELTDAKGKLVGYQTVPVNAAEGQLAGYGAFSVEMPYLVDSPTWVRLSVSQSGTRPDGLTHLSSIEVLVSP
jgi:hypothetical protein